ncbi:MAG: TIR domain-containing protein [bacterium]|nr:TIR domain-containing protein [bacterium]
MQRQEVGVFISYSHEDRLTANLFSQRVEEMGFRTWIDFTELKGGDEWKKSIDRALTQSVAMLVLLTPESVRSSWVQYEVERAQEYNCTVIPLMMRYTALPAFLDHLHYIDFRDRMEQAFKELNRALFQAVVRRGEQQRDPLEDTAPRPGLNVHEVARVDAARIDSARTDAARGDAARTDAARGEAARGDAAQMKGGREEETSENRITTSSLHTHVKPLALAIEDMEAMQEVLRDILSGQGLEVHTASTLNEASVLIRKHRYELITLDMMLGPDDQKTGQDGMYLLDLLQRYQTSVPVVIITSLKWDGRRTREMLVLKGVKDILEKPIQTEELIRVVQRYVVGARGAE